ncbi:MAG: peptidoglycan DD-metalloendopeptidase family protein [Acidimicrobiia bacterium]|nr:peptidoglycan DD-metalloendopeptidase family protein [Acidimicrobiia bacterium]
MTAAAKIDASSATDDQLSGAVATLDKSVHAQVVATDAANQALQAAQVSVQRAEDTLNATRQQIAQYRTVAVDSAIDAYTHAGGPAVLDIIGAKNLSELSQREMYISTLMSNDRDALDNLRGALQDESVEQARLAKARDLMKARRKDAGDKLRSLAQQLKLQATLHGALDARLADYADEAAAAADSEANIQALLAKAQGPGAAAAAAAAGPTSAAGLIWPCHGPLTSPFGMRWGRMHQGQDIACGDGTAIHAAKAGTVVFAGVMSGYGNVVIIDHGGGFSTLYAHQSRMAVQQGQHVNQGDVIGYVGSTGHSTGPHLHFETRFGGAPRNPIPYLPK